jgi:hypothetical protein
MLGRAGSVLDLAAHCNQHVSRGDSQTQAWTSKLQPCYTPAWLGHSTGPANAVKQPFLHEIVEKWLHEGSRCKTGAAPATVTGDKVRQIHWAKSLGRAERRTIRQARRPTVLVPALPILGSSVRLAIPRGAEARRHGREVSSLPFHFRASGVAYPPPPRVAFGCSGGRPATAEQYKHGKAALIDVGTHRGRRGRLPGVQQ